MKHSNDGDDDNDNFNVHDWLIQLNLRLAVWRGAAVSEVLSTQSVSLRLLRNVRNFLELVEPFF